MRKVPCPPLWVGILMPMLLACEKTEAQSVSEAAGGAAPLGELAGVSLGMTVSELVAQRPSATRLEDFLLGEDIDSYSVYYDFPIAFPFGPEPRIEKVFARREFESRSLARGVWEERLTELKGRLGPPTECQRWTTLLGDSERAVWTPSAGQALYFSHSSSLSHGPNRPPTHGVSFLVERADEAARQTETASASGIEVRVIPCPNS